MRRFTDDQVAVLGPSSRRAEGTSSRTASTNRSTYALARLKDELEDSFEARLVTAVMAARDEFRAELTQQLDAARAAARQDLRAEFEAAARTDGQSAFARKSELTSRRSAAKSWRRSTVRLTA